MNIFEFRIFILLCLLIMIGISLVLFFIREKPIRKMMDLSFLYLLLITFIIYILEIKNFETILFPIFIIIFINFLLTLITGISIINNLLSKNTVEQVPQDDDWGYNYETLDDEEDNMEEILNSYSEEEQNNQDDKNNEYDNVENEYNDIDNEDENNQYEDIDENESEDDNKNKDNEEEDNDKEEDNNEEEDNEEENYTIFNTNIQQNDNTNNDIGNIDIQDLKHVFNNSKKDIVEEENNDFNFEEMVKNLDVHNEKNEEFDKNTNNYTKQKLQKIHKVADMIKNQNLNDKEGEDGTN